MNTIAAACAAAPQEPVFWLAIAFACLVIGAIIGVVSTKNYD